jgi:sialate O-acetylesterase
MFVVAFGGNTFVLHGQELQKVKDLKGFWKFSIGDDPEWANPDFDDSDWERIYVPGNWEEQGFHGYDGYAWYRTSFYLNDFDHRSNYYLDLGFIDDVDEVYINGKKIGRTGSFPTYFATAYNAHRVYNLPHKTFQWDKKISIAVRVYDQGGEGGFIHGNIAVMINNDEVLPDLDLQGEWKFSKGDCGDPARNEADFRNWDNILVPGVWEDQGYKNYNGIACYAVEFELEGQFTDEKMVLLLGKVDDLDMVFINGKLVGQSGEFESRTVRENSEMYKQKRGYYLPDGVLNDHGSNVLIVKVLDWYGEGGIWDGSVGLITQENYIKYWRNKRKMVR